MKILSFDVGIKNLAYCILEINENKETSIVKWDIINLCEPKKEKCCKCKKNASYFLKEEEKYCLTHAKQQDNFDMAFIDYEKKKKEELIKLCEKLKCVDSNKLKKDQCLELLNTNKCLFFKKIQSINANNVPMLEIGIAIKNQFKQHFSEMQIDLVLIENQISTIANRMKTIQGMIMEYFILHDLIYIYFVSSSNKLKLEESTNKKTIYKERKQMGIDLCKNHLQNKNWMEYFISHTKKDDLADCFLQACYYIKEKNLGQINIM